MRSLRTLIGGLVVIGLLAAATSAMTAQSSIAKPHAYVGSVDQSITGITVTNVHYTYSTNADADLVSAVDFVIQQPLYSEVPLNVVQIAFTTGSSGADPATQHDWQDCAQPVEPDANGAPSLVATFSDIHCDVTNVGTGGIVDLEAVRLNVQG